jgi:hypothetical protein
MVGRNVMETTINSAMAMGTGDNPVPDTGTRPPDSGTLPGKEPQPEEAKPFAVFPDAESFMARVKREAKKEAEEIIKGLGFENMAALKKAVETIKATEEAGKTEAQKQVEQIAKLQKERDEALAHATKRLIRTECQRLAQDMGFAHPELAYRLVDNLDAFKVGEDEQVEGLPDVLKALLKQYPDLAKPTAPSLTPTHPAGGQQQTGETDAERRKRYFGGQQGPFWSGGGMKITEKTTQEIK